MLGMGFGGLTISLADKFPDKLVLGMEIRAKVCYYSPLNLPSSALNFDFFCVVHIGM